MEKWLGRRENHTILRVGTNQDGGDPDLNSDPEIYFQDMTK